MDSNGRTSAAPLMEEGSSRGIGDVLKDIGEGIQEIIRSEIRLAKVEIADSARRLKSSAIQFSIGGVLGIFAIGFLLLAALLGLEYVMPAWLAALILGVVLLIGASLGISRGRERLKDVHPVAKTVETVKEDLRWMKEQVRL